MFPLSLTTIIHNKNRQNVCTKCAMITLTESVHVRKVHTNGSKIPPHEGHTLPLTGILNKRLTFIHHLG